MTQIKGKCEIMAHIQLQSRKLYFYQVMVLEQKVFDDKIYDTIRCNIKRYRKEKGMTSAQLAEAVGLSHDFIRQIESEKTRSNFSVETLYRISVVLGVGMDRFVER